MGGLIVKKALIPGQHDEYRELFRAVSGMVFLSTPHRGSNLAEILNRILSVCIFIFRGSSTYLN